MSEWYENGLQFACTQCGNCCTGLPGDVWFTDAEGKAMADARGMGIAEFRRQFARREGIRWSLTEVDRGGKFDCVFLDRDADGRVSRKEFDGPPDAFDRLDTNRDGYLEESERPQHRGPPPRGPRPR